MSKIKTVLDRLMDATGLRLHPLEIKIGASRGVLSRAYNNDTDIQAKWLILLIKQFPELNWMSILMDEDYSKLTGEDNYNSKNEKNIVSDVKINYRTEIDHLKQIIEEKDKRLEEKERTINLLMKN